MYALVKTTYKVEVIRDEDGTISVKRKRQKDTVIETYVYEGTARQAASELPNSAEVEYTAAEAIEDVEEDEDE